MSIRQLAAVMEKPYTTVYSWLKGDREPTIDQIREITDIVGLTLPEALEAGDTVIARTDEEKQLLQAYRQLSERERKSVSTLVEAAADQQD